MAIKVTNLQHADFVSTQTRQKIHDLTDTPDGPTFDQRQAFADQHGQRNVTKYWPVDVVLQACWEWGIAPILTQTGKRTVQQHDGLAFASDRGREPQEEPQEEPQPEPQPEPEPEPEPEEEPDPVKTPTDEKARKLAALEALVERTVERLMLEARGKDDEALKDLIAGVSEATAGAVLDTKARDLQAMVQSLTGTLQEENERVIGAALEKIDQARRVEIVVKTPKGENKVEGRTHAAFSRVLKLAGARKNIALIGPTGCGKSHMAEQVAEALGLDYSTQSVTMGMSETKVVGGLLPIGEGGKFEPFLADFVRIWRDGGVFLFDEWDAADPNVALIVNQALANGRLDLPVIGTIYRHADAIAMAAMNTYGTGGDRMYTGRMELDEASLDRFRIGQVEMDYDRELERELVGPEYTDWLHRAWEVRDKIREARTLRRNMSTRFILDGRDMIALGDSIDEVLTAYSLDWSPDERAKVGITPVPLY
jgi:MoxR-like ATPase